MITVSDVRTLFKLSLTDEEITPHLKRASREFESFEFKSKDDEIEIVGSKTIYYLAPHIWIKSNSNAREFDETLETFSDMEKFQEYWLKRSKSLADRYENKDIDGDGEIDIQSSGDFSWRAI